MCTTGCLKFLFNILNIIGAIIGLYLISVALFTTSMAPKSFLVTAMVFGGFFFVTSMIGCCGICQEHSCLTTTYAVIILCIFIGNIVGKFYTFDSAALRKYTVDGIDEKWQEEIYHPGAMNFTQELYQCCGRTGPSDYAPLNRPIPLACYPKQKPNSTFVYQIGCRMAAEEADNEFIVFINSGLWSGIIISGTLCIFAFYLASHFREKEMRYPSY